MFFRAKITPTKSTKTIRNRSTSVLEDSWGPIAPWRKDVPRLGSGPGARSHHGGRSFRRLGADPGAESHHEGRSFRRLGADPGAGSHHGGRSFRLRPGAWFPTQIYICICERSYPTPPENKHRLFPKENSMEQRNKNINRQRIYR